MQFEYVFFDLDGTLTDSALGITRSVKYALEKFGILETDTKKLEQFVGPPLKNSFMNLYDFSEEKATLAIEYYREYYTKTGINENSVYDGVENMLKVLKDAGKKLYVATSKPELFAKQILNNFKLYEYFEFIGGATMDEKMVAKYDIIKYVSTTCGLTDKEGIIMVGDREHDILGAKEFGIKSVGVLYGYGSLEELKAAKADYIVKTPEQVAEIILK